MISGKSLSFSEPQGTLFKKMKEQLLDSVFLGKLYELIQVKRSAESPHLCPTLCGLMASLPVRVFQQEQWSGLPFPPPEGLPYPVIEPKSPESPALQADSFP